MEQPQFISKEAFMSRISRIKLLSEKEFDTYSIVKDEESGQHYLHYSFVHYNLSEGGRKDTYDYFLPLDSDDVIGFLFGEQPFEYPENWKSTYLRSGSDDRLMYFDPTENFGLEKEAEEEQAILEALLRYKAEWNNTEDKEALTKKLFADIEKKKSTD